MKMKTQAFYEEEARAFIKEHPDYEPTPVNRDKLIAALEEKKLDLTRENLAALWKEMKPDERQL